MLDQICNEILSILEKTESFDSREMQHETQKIFSAIQRLSHLEIVDFEAVDSISHKLTAEGSAICKTGSPEYNLLKKVSKNGTSFSDLQEFKSGIPFALENKWISRGDDALVRKIIDSTEDIVKDYLLRIKDVQDPKILNKLKKRKLISVQKEKSYILKKGPKFTTKLVPQATDLTAEMVLTRNYDQFQFKNYNFETIGALPEKGNLHPITKMRDQMAKIFLSMGFQEMKTDKWVESSFWNFDALFQPQDHPSRDAHDTFFVKNGSKIDSDAEYISQVANTHERGIGGSEGYKNTWDISEAEKLVLRTHTTAISARYLSIIAKLISEPKDSNKLEEKFTSSKYNKQISDILEPQDTYKFFSIDKVFRNETADATHLAEFHQIEGVIVGQNLTIGQLMGVLEQFYQKLGLSKLRFKPAFNPYTEPSMEIFGYHDGLNKWIEIGNSGIFRPEMLLPMGFDDSYTVFGWGLSLERPTMIKYNISNIRDLVGHKVSLEFIKNSEICLI